LTPLLTPTPVNGGERPDTLATQHVRFLATWCTSLNVAKRTAVGSKVRRAPVRFLSHLPSSPEFMGGAAL
jgi:hypothetical protein